MDRLKDEVAIITAAGSGMGRGGAVLFAKEGAKVVVSDISEQGGQETVDIIKKAGGEASFFKCDVSKLSDLKELIEFTAKTYGGIDIVWNHAGIPGPAGCDATEEEWDSAMAILLKPCYFIVQYALPYLRKSTHNPAILFTSSTSGLFGSPASPIYSAGKGGVVNLARAYAASLGKENIRCNVIVPGPTSSPMWKGFSERPGSDSPEQVAAFNAATININPMKRMQDPNELASPALALVEPRLPQFATNPRILRRRGGRRPGFARYWHDHHTGCLEDPND